ncbi:hypothetical protein M5E06_10460 [Azospirillum sp. A1-3]|uniref:hypothetical protein n=1 Tax=Azospirillum sp. A1-3 TaxID=185874 RepID=UPI0020777DA0|nr:hypothetical protein [Azospirillum sp. A1-3]MCM8734616.1 hypothetical protein [Azospirillum sp. A1-3]
MGWKVLACVAVLGLGACAPIEKRADITTPTAGPQVAGVGDVMVRFNVTENLPNAFGASDIFGGRRDRGFVELRYAGMLPDGRVVLHRKDVEIMTNETTMSRSGIGFATTNAQVSRYAGGASAVGTTVYTEPTQATVIPLPADAREIVIDLRQGRKLPIQGEMIEIADAQPTMIRYTLIGRQDPK